MDRRLILDILTAIKNNQKEPKCRDFGINIKEFGDAIDFMLSEGLIKNASVQKNGQCNRVITVFLNSARITAKGLEYIKESK